MLRFTYDKPYDVIVCGAGHAGCEAALAASRMGAKTLLLTMNLDTIAQMSCNPAIGGVAKGHLVREIDALGGEMAKLTDRTGIQFRMLNRGKGPAVWAPRAQCDKKLYQFTMKQILEAQPHLDVKQQLVEEILVEDGRAVGVLTQAGVEFRSHAVVVTTGTFLKGLIHIGEVKFSSGRMGEQHAEKTSDCLRRLGFEIKRFKTGTPPRLHRQSIVFSQLEVQQGDEPPEPFSFSTEKITQPQVPCHITYTTEATHTLIRKNLHRSPLYGGVITGIGPRYCPSIEDKVVRFADKERHQLFLEPEGYHTDEIYVNGISTSLPPDIQIAMVRTIPGLERAEIMRFGYAIEYDYAPPTQLHPTLETKLVGHLYFAGQINGTSGYEEAACQGLMAGINAVLKLRREPPLILTRSQAYIGVLIDDLVTKGTDEPYRIFTSRAEHRLLLRQDNADLRLMPMGHELGLISEERWRSCERKRELIHQGLEYLRQTRVGNQTLAEILRRPGMTIERLSECGANGFFAQVPKVLVQQIETEIKYEGYLKREINAVRRFSQLEAKRIPQDFCYQAVKGLRREAVEKLSKIQPASLGQALRIPGMTPSDMTLLAVHLGR